MHAYTARCLLPVTSPPIRNGVVVTNDGRIVATGARREILGALGDDVACTDLGNVVLLPGLVNAHTHLELSFMGRNRPAGGDYVAWVRGLLGRRADEDRPAALAAAEDAVGFMVRRGTAVVGDVANGTWIPEPLGRSSLCGVVFHEVFGFRASDAEGLMRQALERVTAMRKNLTAPNAAPASAGNWRVALTPHAPHTSSAALLRRLGHEAVRTSRKLSIHVAESRAECELIDGGHGEFAELFRERGVWDEDYSPAGLSPLAYCDRLGLLGPHTLAVHCVHLHATDHSLLQSRRATVVTCPRSNTYLGVGRAPIPQLLGQGIPVALGTDSLASAPDLDLFSEIAAARRAWPELTPAALLRMATMNGAAALGLDDRFGSIAAGKSAHLLVVPMNSADDDPLEIVSGVPESVGWLDELGDGAVA